jgi:purine-binding chemotaxis protein CheW
MEATKQNRGAGAAGKYLTFSLSGESYGIEVLKIREITRQQPITPVPQIPSHIKGVINLRGRIIPVIDLRIRSGLPLPEDTTQTRIVVVQVTRPRPPRSSWAWSWMRWTK